MYNFDAGRFQVISMFDVVMCSSFLEATRIVTSHIEEMFSMMKLNLNDYEFDIKLEEVRTPTQREHDRADMGENELASDNEFWNFAYKFEGYARKIDASE